MHIRPLEVDDHLATAEVLIEAFGPFFEGYVRPLLGEPVFRHQHGQWEQDYRDELPALQDPERGRYAAIAQRAEGAIAGLVSWRFDPKPHHGEIYLLAVAPAHRRQHVGRRLCEHAIAHLRAGGVEVVEVRTGGDPFHAPARALYEGLGCIPIPTMAYLGAIGG